jgi:PAS domain S-box-containing protein
LKYEKIVKKIMFSKKKNIDKLSPPDEEEFKKLVELLPEIVSRTDKELKITFLNKNGLKITGYTKKDIKKGLNIFDLIKEDDKSRARKNIKKILENKIIGLNEYTIVRKDGSFFQVLANSNVIEDGNGSFSGLRIVAMDLTEKNKIKKKLMEEEQKYKLLAENVNDIIFVQDMNLNIKYASPSANKIFG